MDAKDLSPLVQEGLEKSLFSASGLGLIDFKNHKVSVSMQGQLSGRPLEEDTLFDLASLTKPLTLGLWHLARPQDFGRPQELLLGHRGGLPAWQELHSENWREQLDSFDVVESETVYSDLGFLKLMLYLERTTGFNLASFCAPYFENDVCWWTDLALPGPYPVTGAREGKEICGEVHDNNAWRLGRACAHAGLFSSTRGLCRLLLRWNAELNLLGKLARAARVGRFVRGWDTPSGPRSLAGEGIDQHLGFGHLGFTGTSVWIDPRRQSGWVWLTNASCYHEQNREAFNREAFNALRRRLGHAVWAMRK